LRVQFQGGNQGSEDGSLKGKKVKPTYTKSLSFTKGGDGRVSRGRYFEWPGFTEDSDETTGSGRGPGSQ